MRGDLSAVAVVCLCAIAFAPREAAAWGSALGSWGTHHRITEDVIDNDIDTTTYPDLMRFRDKLEDGSNTECHNLPDDNNTQWWGNGVGPAPKNWFDPVSPPTDGQEGALSLYNKYDFVNAYDEMGFELHCLQDERVPAHERRCCHGTQWYWHYLDEMEKWAYFGTFGYASSSSPWTYQFMHSGGTSTFEYWLSDGMDDDNENDVGSGDSNDEVDQNGVLITDGPDEWGVPKTDWGTYGQPPYSVDQVTGQNVLLETLPGKNQGSDFYGNILGNGILTQEQLKKSIVIP